MNPVPLVPPAPASQEAGAAVPEFSDEVLGQFDLMRRCGCCNMVDRRCVAEYAGLMDMEALAAVASDKRRYPRLLVAYRREVAGA